MGVRREGRVGRSWTSSGLGGLGRRLERGIHLEARECHFSFGSPSRKVLSAQRGWGLPVNVWVWVWVRGEGMGLPRSSRTRLSSSAIRFLRRVVSSSVGSSLGNNDEIKDRKKSKEMRTLMQGRQSRIRIAQSRIRVNWSFPDVSRQPIYQAKLDASLARSFAIALHENCRRRARGKKRRTHLSFGCVAVETALRGPVSSSFPGAKRPLSSLRVATSTRSVAHLWSVSTVNSRSMISPFSWRGWNWSAGIIVQREEGTDFRGLMLTLRGSGAIT